MKKLLTSVAMAMAIFIAIASPVSAKADTIPELTLMHFSGSNERGWELDPAGFVVVYYKCRFHGFVYATFHDVVDSGFGITSVSAIGYNFLVRLRLIPTEAGLFGYLFKANPFMYARVELASYGPRYIYIAKDPSEDGINGNEIPWKP